jgi:hypothetical protein
MEKPEETETQSSTERQEPNRLIPYTLTVLPKRANERIDNALPRTNVSSTERVEPNLVIP